MYLATDGYKGDEYALNVLFNNTGLWYKYEVAGDAMMFNKKVWNWAWGDLTNAQLWQPWTINYDAFTGETGHGALTCLIGTAEWVFVTYNAPGPYALEMANRPFSITTPVTWTYTGHYWAPFLREDNDWNGKVDMIDMWNVQRAFGSTPGSPKWNYGQYDIVQNWLVDMIDLWDTQRKFGAITLPP